VQLGQLIFGTTPTTYDGGGDITQDTKFRQMNYRYDANSRQTFAEQIGGANPQTALYDGAGQRVETMANGLARLMVHDIFGQDIAEYSVGFLERENIYRGGQLLAVYEVPYTCYKTIPQFIRDFYQGVLARQPDAAELLYWTNTLTAAQAEGQAQVIAAAQSLGNTLFTSQEYLNRNRTDPEYVQDLYTGYLEREPDAGGWDYWTEQVAISGRDAVRQAFAESVEFQFNASHLCDAGNRQPRTVQNVTWIDAVGVSVVGNSLTKTAPSGWGNAGAISTAAIASGDGDVQFTASEATTRRMCGLSNGDTDQSYQDIDFAIFLNDQGQLAVYESGVEVYLSGPGFYVAGDRFTVAVEAGKVKYSRNGTVFYTNNAPVLRYPLLVDAALDTTGATITNVVISGLLVDWSLSGLKYVLQDVQSSTRVVMSGNQIVARHDYLPFGEEISAGTGLRTTAKRYAAPERIRQQYAGMERDDVTGLDHTWWRQYENRAGRWTSTDPLPGSIGNPQSLNRYAYVQNDPVNFVDPSGLEQCKDADGNIISCGPDVIHDVIRIYTDEFSWGAWNSMSQLFARYRAISEFEATKWRIGRIEPPEPQTQNTTPVDRAGQLLGQQDCANFIAELISLAASLAGQPGGLITPSFGPLLDPSGGLTPSFDQHYGLNEYQRAVTAGRVMASGNSGRSGDVITYGTTRNYNAISWNREFYSLDRDAAARHIIHESLHLIPNFSDFALAGAASLMATRGRNNPGNTGNFRNQSAASQYLNQQIARHCR
jgi:RHS repeat-associated protein